MVVARVEAFNQLDPRVRCRRPRSRSLSSRAISRSASRCAIARRLSKDRRPRARAISTFAQPSWNLTSLTIMDLLAGSVR
jgi:hypothetical protein